MKRAIFFTAFLCAFLNVFSQKKTDTNIFGHVVCGQEHLPFANVSVKGTTIGTQTDATGHYRLLNVPIGRLTIEVTYVGYKNQTTQVETRKGETLEVNFDLEADVFGLDEVVVSGNRNEEKRKDIPVVITKISPKLLNITQSVSLGEGLNYCPGLRLENDCQNCGFTQIRMNGMEGPYSQILINGRPIFSGLAGVYGLELIPSNMLDRIEVMKGGGSALFGSNAIAGTINLILKTPVNNSFEAGFSGGATGVGVKNASPAGDYSGNFNTTLVSDDGKTGLALYGFTRHRLPFDANGDDFSELSKISNLTLGTRLTYRLGGRSKIALDFFTIKEKRDGGDNLDDVLHERNISEAVQHDIKTAAISFDQYLRDDDVLTAFVSGQFLNRDSYYGAEKSLSDYGLTTDNTCNFGVQYKASLGRHHAIIAGVEETMGFLHDTKLGYPDIDNAVVGPDSTIIVPHEPKRPVSKQNSKTGGTFLQYELKYKWLKLYLGGRYDHYAITDEEKSDADAGPIAGDVFSPRVSVMFDLIKDMQLRLGYSQGYRAPQIFDEDLHIETSGSRQVLHKNAPDLQQETGHSATLSLDYAVKLKKFYSSFLVEGFFTRLQNPFVNDIGTPDAQGVVVYTRCNAEGGATVAGLNAEVKLNYINKLYLNMGYTYQNSRYDEAQDFDEHKFFRTPDSYGFLAIDYNITRNFDVAVSGNYVGRMLVPYFGPAPQSDDYDPEIGELHTSKPFFDMGIKVQYKFKIGSSLCSIYAGVKNVFNSYQDDFDSGIARDPGYIYGPGAPRMVYAGLKIGNLLSSINN